MAAISHKLGICDLRKKNWKNFFLIFLWPPSNLKRWWKCSLGVGGHFDPCLVTWICTDFVRQKIYGPFSENSAFHVYLTFLDVSSDKMSEMTPITIFWYWFLKKKYWMIIRRRDIVKMSDNIFLAGINLLNTLHKFGLAAIYMWPAALVRSSIFSTFTETCMIHKTFWNLWRC